MSDFQSRRDLQTYLERLLDQSKPNSNDKRHCDYVKYINGFLSYFGREQVHLVGSTAEQTKLRFSLDNGDADFILVSGRLTVPVSQIEYRTDTPCYVWIRGENLNSEKNLGIDMVEACDGKKYLPAEVLHDIDARLFTILRGIYKFVTTNTDGVPGRQTRVTTLGERSNVGLARTELRGLEIKDKHKIPQLRKYFPKCLPSREQDVKRQQTDKDKDDINKILELIALFGSPGDPLEHEGQFAHFADVVKLLRDRQEIETMKMREKEPIVKFDDFSSDDMKHCSNEASQNIDDGDDFEVFINDLDLPTDVKATYKEKTMKDFVPALRIEGKLECMDKWFKENGKWLSDEVKIDIYNSELYVVAKDAPLDPNERDFCLSFNHAEVMLAKALTQTQRKCLLMLKAYYKGIFEKIMNNHNTNHILKSFHLKTALYWVLEEPVDSQFWREENIIAAVRRVLKFLREALLKKRLPHYFTQSNLFAGMETGSCLSLIGGIDQVLEDPVMGLKEFFDLEKEGDTEIILTEEQIRCIIEMSRDGGVENAANNLEDLLEDFNRGFKEAPRDENGNAPLREAMNHVMNLYLQDEAERKAKEELKKLNMPAAENLGGIISGFLGSLASSSAQQTSSASQNVGRQSSNPGDSLVGLASQLLQGNLQPSREQGNSNDTTRRQDTRLTERPRDHGRQLADAVNAFFDDSARGNRRLSVEGELKQLGLSYFLGKPE